MYSWVFVLTRERKSEHVLSIFEWFFVIYFSTHIVFGTCIYHMKIDWLAWRHLVVVVARTIIWCIYTVSWWSMNDWRWRHLGVQMQQHICIFLCLLVFRYEIASEINIFNLYFSSSSSRRYGMSWGTNIKINRNSWLKTRYWDRNKDYQWYWRKAANFPFV